jgi:hypothetical protein
MPTDILVFVRAPSVRARRIGLRILMASFFAGALVTVTTSGGMLWERLSFGDPGVASAVGGGMLLSASLLLLLTQRVRVLAFRLAFDSLRTSPLFTQQRLEGHVIYRMRGSTFLAAQLAGALTGASTVCAATHLGPLAATNWLSANPALLVNDVVAGGAILLLVWAIARNLDTRLLVTALLVLTAYHFTEGKWHVMGAPRAFLVTVQRALLVQFVAIALALIHAKARTFAPK